MRRLLIVASVLSSSVGWAQTPQLPPFCTEHVDAMTRTLFNYCNQKRAELNLPVFKDQGRYNSQEPTRTTPR